jgi:hypothetical protein
MNVVGEWGVHCIDGSVVTKDITKEEVKPRQRKARVQFVTTISEVDVMRGLQMKEVHVLCDMWRSIERKQLN